MMKKALLLVCLATLLLPATTAQPLPTRGIGMYPGNPAEYFGPTIVPGGDYRNVALHRPVRQSSAWDFNLTAQLLTDGVISHEEPAWLSVSTPAGEHPMPGREATIDGNEWTSCTLMGSDTWLQYDWHGMSIDVDEVQLVCSMAYMPERSSGSVMRLLTSSDGKHWTVADECSADSLPGTSSRRQVHSDPNKQDSGDRLLPTRNINHSFKLPVASHSHLRIELKSPAAAHWTITEVRMRRGGTAARHILPATHFTSAWRSSGKNSDEWLEIDLGADATIDKVNMHWIDTPAPVRVEVSDNSHDWRVATAVTRAEQCGMQEITFTPTRCRYVRLGMPRAEGDTTCYTLSEVEVMGTGGVTIVPHAPAGRDGSRWLLDGGDWRLQRASLVPAGGESISMPDFNAGEWLPATVPATVLSSYVNAGALPDMNHDDNLLLASESWFGGDFWYRRTFDLPREMTGRRVMLNLDGINWKADIWLNGEKMGRIEGAFKRGKFDITPYLKPTGNVLAVRIIANANPGGVKLKTAQSTDFNGGILGADNPTFHATIGWDWISTIRGRNIGIWDDVYLTASGDVTVSDPVVTTILATGDTLATITPAVMLTNHALHPVRGTITGHIGNIRFDQDIALPADTTIEVVFSPDDYPQLRHRRMRLWWPNGYGEPYLHEAEFSFAAAGRPCDSIHYRAGIRQVTTTGRDSLLRIYVNNRRVVPLGGNWGFSENNLNYRGREYDAAVRYHREMNCNMIRNWVGMTADEEFYDACDRYGVMVWQDFWLANPADGPDPADEPMFMDNAHDLVKKIRRHPCITIYCGRNEGYPPETLDRGLRQAVAELHPGMDYISNSADDGVSGHGPYHALAPAEYFSRQTGKLHTERGMPCVMTTEGLSRTLDAGHLWPQNEFWGRHDFTLQGAQRGESFNRMIADDFGSPASMREFTEWAQWVNYEGYRAMYEAGSRDRMGLLIWMSHPCWPTMAWQTYDYYLEPTAAYFGVKHACEPLHVQWNPITTNVEVINRSAGHQQGTVKAVAIALDGTELWAESRPYNCDEDTTLQAMPVALPSDFRGVYILRLTLTDNQGRLRSQNDYVCSTSGSRKVLRTLPQAIVDAAVTMSGTKAIVTLENTGTVPAMMLRLNLNGSDGEQILPVIYSDNYFHLLPGERRTITIEWNPADARNTTPQIEITGANVLPIMVTF